MTATRNAFSWSLLILGLIWGCLQFNGAFYAAWVSGGPPTTNPEGWLFVAGNRLAWGAASFIAGFSFFFLLRSGRLSNRYPVAGLIAAILLTAFPYVREFIASDACLDSGGRWTDLRCDH